MPHVDLLYRAANDQESRQPGLLRDTIPFIVLATLAVIGRFFSTRLRPASFGADDYVCFLALVRVLPLVYQSSRTQIAVNLDFDLGKFRSCYHR